MQCAIIPSVFNPITGKNEQSELFKDWNGHLKTIVTNNKSDSLIDILKNIASEGFIEDSSDYSVLARNFITHMFQVMDARTPKGATGYPTYKTGELLLANALATLYYDPTYSPKFHKNIISLYNLLGFDKELPIQQRFVPVVLRSNNFKREDQNLVARCLTRIYFELRKEGVDHTINIKENIINRLELDIQSLIDSKKVTVNLSKNQFVDSVLEDLRKGDSSLYLYFIHYLKRNFDINILDYESRIDGILEDNTEEAQTSNIEAVRNVWDDIQKDRIDRKQSLSSNVKIKLQLLLNGEDFGRVGDTKLYVSNPVDVNALWNQLVSAFKHCVEFKDFHKRITELASTNPSFTKIKEYFDKVDAEFKTLGEEDYKSENWAFVNSFMNGVGLALIPVNTLNIKGDVQLFEANRLAQAENVHFDNIIERIEFGKKSKLYAFLKDYKTHEALKTKLTVNSDLDSIVDTIFKVIRDLRLPISNKAINQFLNDYDNEDTQGALKRIAELSYNVYKLTDAIKSFIANDKAFDGYGYVDKLANIASYDFNSYTKQTYSDVNNMMNYTPQYDSYITKFFKGFKTQTSVNINYIERVFKDYLNDKTMSLNPLLRYNPISGIGIFNEDGSVNGNFANSVMKGEQFNISMFNGVKFAYNSKKYNELNGSTYNYSEMLLNMLGQYVILTSDSSRSYMISIKRYGIDDLFIDNDLSKLNHESVIYNAIRNILNEDINKVLQFAPEVLSLEDNEEGYAKMRLRHNVKYWNGKRIIENGIPTGRAFQFINLTYKDVDGNTIDYPTFVANKLGITKAEFYGKLINEVKDNTLNKTSLFNSEYRTEFVDEWIKNYIRNEVESNKDIIPTLIDTVITIDGKTYTPFKDVLAKDIEELEKTSNDPKAVKEFLNDPNIWQNPNIQRAIAKIVLNQTIYTHAFHALFAGDQEEYKNSTDLNKRIAQIVKNGFTSTSVDNSTRKVLVIDDMNFRSTIFNDLFEGKWAIQNPFVRNAYLKPATINDSMSIITDKALVKLLKSTGRYDPDSDLVKLIETLQNPKEGEPIDWTAYSKLVEQLKLFGTCRRRRGDFYTSSEDAFADEVDTVQIKDSTIVLFEATTRGTALGDLYDNMIDNNIDQISPKSAVKVSGVTPIKIHTDEGRLNLDVFKESLDAHTLTMRQDDFVIQQDIPADILDEETILGTQLVKQILEGLNWNEAVYDLNGNKYTGEQIFKHFSELLVANIQEDSKELLYELGLADELGNLNTEQVDIVKLVQKLQKIVDDNSDYNVLREGLEIQEDGKPLLPLSYPVIKAKIESTLASLFTKRVIDQKLPGIHAPIVSDLWWYGNDTINFVADSNWTQEQINEYADKVMFELSNSSITYSEEFINSRIEEFKKGTEVDGKLIHKLDFRLRADYHDDNGYHYAEVILNPWMLDFYNNIVTTKTITYSDGRTVDMQVVDINKISEEARQMFGIRIPTEGKQSMVVFKVVGFMNTGSTQAVFPASLVTRTGWDFDIDSIYVYLKNLEFKDGIYTPIKYKESTDEIKKDSKDNSNRKYKDPLYKKVALKGTKEHPHQLAGKAFISKVEEAIDNFDINSIITSFKTDISNPKISQAYRNWLKTNIPRFERIQSLRNKLVKLYSQFNAQDLQYLRNSQANYESVLSDNATSKLFDMYKTLSRITQLYANAYSNIPENIKSVDYSYSSEDIFDILNQLFDTLDYVYELQDSIDARYELAKSRQYETSSVAELNNRSARENRMIEVLTSIHSSFEHREAVNKANDMEEVSKTSQYFNAKWDQDINSFNPNNMSDKMSLNNMSMASTIIKGYSVNMDTNLAVLSTINAKLSEPIIQVLDFDELPQPSEFTSRDDMYKKGSDGKYRLTKQYRKWLEDIVGTKVEVDSKRDVVIIKDVYINNDANNTHRDISGESVSLQMNQWTSAILDVLKSQLIFTLNTETLSILRALTMGTVIRQYSNIKGININNRFVHAIAFIAQPAIVRAVQIHSQAVLTKTNYSFKNAIDDSLKSYNKELVALYMRLVNESEGQNKIKSHKAIEECIKSDYANLPKYAIKDLCDYFKTNIKSINETDGYLTVKELEQCIEDRNSTDITTRANYLISQIAVLNQYKTVQSITDDVVAFGFLTKTESDVNNFHSADMKKLNIADYYYPLNKMKNDIKKRYATTFNYVKQLRFTNPNLWADFINLTSFEFSKTYQIYDREGNAIAPITFKDLTNFNNDIALASDIKSRADIVDRYGIEFTRKNQILLSNGNDAVTEIFSKAEAEYTPNTSVETSIYPIIEARYAYSHALVSKVFDNVLIQQNPVLRSIVMGKLLNNSTRIQPDTYKDVLDQVTTALISVLGREHTSATTNDAFINPSHRESIDILLNKKGLNDESQKAHWDVLQANPPKNGYNVPTFRAFTQLNILNQLRFIKSDDTLRDYIEKSPEFNNSNIVNFLVITKTNKLSVIVDDSNPVLLSDIVRSIDIMWDSQNPYIAHFIRSLIAYTYISEGFTFAYNISKYISPELLSKPRHNEEYDKIVKAIGYVDPTANLSSYRDNVYSAENKFKHLADNMIVEKVLDIISQVDLRLNPAMLSGRAQSELWASNPQVATIGYIDSRYIEPNDRTNLASVNYMDANSKMRQCYLEVESRVLNSKYANANYITKQINSYEKYLYKKEVLKVFADNDPFSTIVVYVPMMPMSKNEIAISETGHSISADQIALEQVQTEKGLVDRMTYLREDPEIAKQCQELLKAYQTSFNKEYVVEETDDFNQTSDEDSQVVDNSQTEDSDEYAYTDLGIIPEEVKIDHNTPINNIKFVHKPVFDIIDDLVENATNSIFITKSSSTGIFENKHRNLIKVDYTKSPYDEALRISKDLKPGSLYINGDTHTNFNNSENEVRNWVSEFITNLNTINPQYNKLSTLIHKGIGAYVAYTYVPYEQENVSIIEDTDELYNTLIVVDKANSEVKRKYETNANIAVDIINLTKRVQTMLHKNNLTGSNEVINLVKKFEDLDYENGIKQALEDFNRNAIKDAYKVIADIVPQITVIASKLYEQLKTIDYASIVENAQAVHAYKEKLNNLRKLISYFEVYSKINEFNISDTNYDEDVEDDVVKFKNEFDEINDNIRKIKAFTNSMIEKSTYVTTAVKEMIAYQVLKRSRNPKFVTEFAKIKQYLYEHNGDLTNIDKTQLSVTEDEWNELLAILFTFDKDITRIQKMLDSAFVTGIEIIDNLGKSWDEANRINTRKRISVVNRLEKALEDLEQGLSKNGKRREEYMHKFITDEGDLISIYNNNPYSDIRLLQFKINDALQKIEEDNSLSDANKGRKAYETVNKLIEDFNSNNSNFTLVKLSEDEANNHWNKLAKESHRDKIVYLQTNDLAIINQPKDIFETSNEILYKIEFKEDALNEVYKNLTYKEQQFIKTLKALIQETIRDYDPQWISYTAVSHDSVMPYLPKADLQHTLKAFVSVPSIRIDNKYTDIDGKSYYVLNAKTLEIPKYYPVYNMPKQREGESGNNYTERVLNHFREWFDRNNKIEGIENNFNTLNDIRNYKRRVLRENKRHKAQVMSYDILDVMKSFTFELYNNKAIKDFTLDHAMVDYLFDQPNRNVTPRQVLKNASEQLENMMNRIVGASKHQGFADVAAGALLRFTSMSFMYFNYSAGITNILKGVTDMIVESNAKGFVDSKSLKQGLGDMMKLITPYLRDLRSATTSDRNVAIIKDFDDIYQDTNDVNASLTGTSFMVKALGMMDKAGYSFNGMGEFIMQFGMLLAATHSHRVVNFGKHTRIFSFQDYFDDALETTLLNILTPEQANKYQEFKEEYKDRINVQQKKSKYKIHFDNNYVTPFLAENPDLLSKEQKDKFVATRKMDMKEQRKNFEKLPTLNSQLELKDGMLNYKEGSGLTEEAMAEFKARVKAINQSLHGIYNRVDRMALQDYALTDLLIQFKKWMRPNLNRMIGRIAGNLFYNEQIGGYEVPIVKAWYDMINTAKQAWRKTLKEQNTFMDYAKALRNFLTSILKFVSNAQFYYNTLPIYEQASAIKLAKFGASVAFAILVMIAAGSLKDEDDWVTQNIAYLGVSYYSQITEQVPIFGWGRTVSQSLDSLFAGQTILENSIKLMNLTVQSLWVADDEMIYDRGIYKGQDKRKVTLTKLMPITRQINKAVNIGATMTYYNQYDPFGFKFEGLRNTIRTLISGNESDNDWEDWDNE